MSTVHLHTLVRKVGDLDPQDMVAITTIFRWWRTAQAEALETASIQGFVEVSLVRNFLGKVVTNMMDISREDIESVIESFDDPDEMLDQAEKLLREYLEE